MKSLNIWRRLIMNKRNVLVFGASNLESNAAEFYNPATAIWSRTGCY